MLSPETQSRLAYLGSVYGDMERKFAAAAGNQTSVTTRSSSTVAANNAITSNSTNNNATSTPGLDVSQRWRGRPFTPVSAWAAELDEPIDDFASPSREFMALRSQHGQQLQQALQTPQHYGGVSSSLPLSSPGPSSMSAHASSAVLGSGLETRVHVLENNARLFREYLTKLLDQVG
jgi:hypothetical protein